MGGDDNACHARRSFRQQRNARPDCQRHRQQHRCEHAKGADAQRVTTAWPLQRDDQQAKSNGARHAVNDTDDRPAC